MAKRKAEGHVAREYCNEYYRKAGHLNPTRKGFTKDVYGAMVGAVKHIVLGHCEKVVCVKRSNGKVIWTRFKGPNGSILRFGGDLPHEEKNT